MMTERYLVWSNEQRAWWRPDRRGYTVKLDAAGQYTKAEALDICAHAREGFKGGDAPSDIPVRWDDVVDCLIARKNALEALISRGSQ